MTSRMEVLDAVEKLVAEKFGHHRVGRAPGGEILIAGTSEAFSLDATVIEGPDGVDEFSFGEDLVASKKT